MNDENAILMQFAHKIKKERVKRNLSQEDFAELMGFHRTYIGMLERGERNITLMNLGKMAKALNMEVKTLLDFDDDTQ